MKRKALQAVLSVAVVLFVGIFGWAHGTPGRRKVPPTLEEVSLGLCRGEGGQDIVSEDVPWYPGSGGMTMNLDSRAVLYYTIIPASIRAVLGFYRASLAGNGWREVDSPPLTDPFILWFHKGGRVCLASFSSGGPGITNVVLITR